jgi:hypothetical protein
MSMRESIRSGGHVLGAHEVDIPTIVFRAGQAYNIRDNSSAVRCVSFLGRFRGGAGGRTRRRRHGAMAARCGGVVC